MRPSPLTLLFVLIVGTCSASAGEPKGKVVMDLWDSAYLQGNRAGYVHTITHEYTQNRLKILRTSVEYRLTLKRNTEAIELSTSTGTTETEEGKVLSVFTKQSLGKNKVLELVGTVVGDQIRFVQDGTKALRPEPWDKRALGLYRQQKLFQEQQVKTGDEFAFITYETPAMVALRATVKVKGYEEVELLGGLQKKKLLRAELRTEKVGKVQMPPVTFWLGESRTIQRQQFNAPGLGTVVLYRTSQAVAKAPNDAANLTEIGLSHSVPLKQGIASPSTTTAASYRIVIRGDDDVGSAFSSDDRQTVKNVKGNSFELYVKATNVPAKGKEEKAAGEFTQSSYFINSDDPLVKQHARKAVGAEKDVWKKALLIEKWVHDSVQDANNETLATADHVARTLKGDCTEYAMLMAAMCRAEGVPSRTAMGLVYAEVNNSPGFAFHMWTEVFVRGRWIALDATKGLGRVGATHLKIADHSWHETRTLTPLFPVMRVLGRVSIDVLSAENMAKP